MCASSKNGEMGLFRQCFKAEVKFLKQKCLPRLAPFAGGMKFASQISPLLNLMFFTCLQSKYWSKAGRFHLNPEIVSSRVIFSLRMFFFVVCVIV